ncbi:hypothetical protein SHKM778_72060 [Streptomyces sp. KM77-8]|uniref:Uncharacterized protein n=1 Tax=Streptomyces haneummycinicus TaxID=3074435 RepID=A0AAT9HTX1_9ACTN
MAELPLRQAELPYEHAALKHGRKGEGGARRRGSAAPALSSHSRRPPEGRAARRQVRALGVPPAEGWGSAGTWATYWMYSAQGPVRREGVHGVARQAGSDDRA